MSNKSESQFHPSGRLLRGFVVANNDPKHQGRVQVRIPELHGFDSNALNSETQGNSTGNYKVFEMDSSNSGISSNSISNNKSDFIETANLPWAQVLMPMDFIGFQKAPQDAKEIKSEKLSGTEKNTELYRSISREGERRGGFGKNIVLNPGTYVWIQQLGGSDNDLLVIGTYASENEFSNLTKPTGENPSNSCVYDSISGHYYTFDDATGDILIHNRSGTQFRWDSNGNSYNDVVANKNTSVQGNEIYHIDGSNTFRIGSTNTGLIEADQNITVKANDTLNVESNQNITIKGNKTDKISGSENIEVSGSTAIKTGGFRNDNTSGTHKITASVIYLN